MNDRVIDLGKTVHDLCAADPGIAVMLREAGFGDLVRPGMLATAGRFTTISKSAAVRGIHPGYIREVFERHGYTVHDA